ncbi:MAG: type II secretion system F family protein [Desulfobacterales bacterium]|nr:type II secretion system F family protein [Desulfobacterales bacterium]
MAISSQQKTSKAAEKSARASGESPGKKSSGLQFSFGRKVKSQEVVVFTSQLSLMLEVGSSLTTSLKALALQVKNPHFKEILQAMTGDIEEGRQLSEAMKRYPRIFDITFVSMVKAGEAGGYLKSMLDRLVEMQEKRQALVAQLKSAMTYPVVLCLLALGVVIFVIVGLLPKFMTFFQGKESLLPFTTRFLMAASTSMRGYWWGYLAVLAGLVTGLTFLFKSSAGKKFMGKFAIYAPVISNLTNKIYTNQLLRTLGNLIASRVTLIEALKVTKTTLANAYYRQFIDTIMSQIEQGGTFSKPFAASPFIMESVKQMIATGEESGNLDKVMLRLAEFYDTEIDQELKTIASLIEPLALIFLGAVVGLIVSSIILPLFKMSMAVH